MPHDFKQFPELTNSQMAMYYFDSPHKQITENFEAEVVKVHDGDTITLRWDERDFDFPLRLLNINAPELNEEGGEESQRWMEQRLLGKTIEVIINPSNRVDKYGRLLGDVFDGVDIGDEMIRDGMATPFDSRDEGEIPDVETWQA